MTTLAYMTYARVAKSLVTVSLSLTLAISLASCSQTPGSPVPESPNATTTQPTSTAKDELVAIDPCNLLTKAEVSKFGANPGERSDTSTAGCGWLVPGTGVIGVVVRPEQSLDDIIVDNDTLTDHRVNGRDGRKLESNDDSGSCVVSISVTPSSRVDAHANTGRSPEKACGLAEKVAEMVEPKLPKGE